MNNIWQKLKEDQGDDLQVISLTKEAILKIVKEEFTSDDSRPEDADSYLLPDGTFIEMFNDIEIDEKNKDYITNPSQTYQHKHVDLFLKSIDVTISISPSNMSRSLFFERITGSIAMYSSPYDEDAVIYLNKNEPTEKQYEALSDFISEAIDEDSKLIIKKPDNKVVSQKELQDLTEIEIVNIIKSFYRPGSIKEEIDHEKVYDSLTFSNEPDKGPIFISDDGMFVNLGKLSFHSKIFNGKDYEADDYYFLNDEYDLIKANGGNRFEPFAYIDLWKIPNPAQKKAIISWMYYLIEWNTFELQVNTSQSNETYSLTNKIPEEVYKDIIRHNFSTTEGTTLEEGKKDEQNLINFAGEELAKRFLAIRQKLKSPENDFYYWIKNKTPQELEDFLKEKESTKSSVQIKREIKDEGAELVTEGNGYKVYKIKTYEASCLYGASTKWCISSDDISHWKGYKKEGAEFYFFIGHGTKYALMVKRRAEVIKLPRTIMFFFSDEEPPKKKTIKTNIELYNEQDDLITEKYDELNLPKIPGVNIVFKILSVE